MSGFFAMMARMKGISRWALMRSILPENVQEHSHMTAILAHALAVIRRDIYGIDCDPDRAAAIALYHDASEILTGDLPTPIKYNNPDIMAAYRKVEADASQRLLSMLPPQLRPAYEDLLEPQDESLRRLVKAADKLSAYIKCIEERRAGNDEFLEAERRSLQTIREYDLPEANYFLEHFIPAFEYTLDELGTMDYQEQP